MDDNRVPSPQLVMAMASACPTTTHGWLWYCSVHDVHGTANSQHEAEFVSGAHSRYHDEGQFAHRCAVVTWLRTKHERIAGV